MAKISFTKLGLKTKLDTKTLKLNNNEITVKQYLPQADKADLIQWIVDNAINDKMGTFSPIVVETYFSIAVLKYYTDITFTEKQLTDITKTYDALESNKVFANIFALIPEEEFKFINSAVSDTIKMVSDFNSSFAGMITAMSGEANNLDSQLNTILTQIKNREGIEELSAIREVMGKTE